MQEEHSKRKAREERLVQEVRTLQSQLNRRGDLGGSDQENGSLDSHLPQSPAHINSTVPSKQVSGQHDGMVAHNTDNLPGDLLPQQLPPLTKFSGEDFENEPFEDWLAQFGMIAETCKWSPPTRLVHLTTHLCGQAFIALVPQLQSQFMGCKWLR